MKWEDLKDALETSQITLTLRIFISCIQIFSTSRKNVAVSSTICILLNNGVSSCSFKKKRKHLGKVRDSGMFGNVGKALMCPSQHSLC